MDPISGEKAQAFSNLIIDAPSIRTVVVTGDWANKGHELDDLVSLAERLQQAGKTVYVTSDLPRFSFPATACKYPRSLLGWPPRICHASISDPPFIRALEDFAEYEIFVLETYQLFCTRGQCSMLTDSGRLAFRDSHHLSIAGSVYVARQINEQIAFPTNS